MKIEFQKIADTPKPLNIWLAEDDPVVRELLAEFLDRGKHLSCTRQFSCAEEVLCALRLEPSPDLILLDLNMGVLDGIEAIEPIKRVAPESRVFIMTTFYDTLALTRARNAGASGFFLKREDWDEAILQMLNPATDWTATAGPKSKTLAARRTASPCFACPEPSPA